MNIKEEQLSNITKLQIANKKTWRKVAGKILLITAPLVFMSGITVYGKSLEMAPVSFVREGIITYKHTTKESNQDEQIITFKDYLPSKDSEDSVLIHKKAEKLEKNVITYAISEVDMEILREAAINNDTDLIIEYLEQEISQSEEFANLYNKEDITNGGEVSVIINLEDINDLKDVPESEVSTLQLIGEAALYVTLWVAGLVGLIAVCKVIEISNKPPNRQKIKKSR